MKNPIQLIMVLFFLATFTACNKDDDDSVSSALIGTWAEAPSQEQFTFTFNADEHGTFQVKDCTTNSIYESESFSFSHDSKTNNIVFTGFNEDYCYVKFISTKSIQLYEDADYKDELSLVMYKQ